MYRCKICFDPLGSSDNVLATPCGHMFCAPCLEKALRMKPTCPVCRATVILASETATTTDIFELVSTLSRRFTAARSELQLLRPRPIRLFLDDDAIEQPPESEDGTEWFHKRIAQLEAQLKEASELVGLMEAERDSAVEKISLELRMSRAKAKDAEERAHGISNKFGEQWERFQEAYGTICEQRDALLREGSSLEERCMDAEGRRVAAELLVKTQDVELQDLRHRLSQAADAVVKEKKLNKRLRLERLVQRQSKTAAPDGRLTDTSNTVQQPPEGLENTLVCLAKSDDNEHSPHNLSIVDEWTDTQMDDQLIIASRRRAERQGLLDASKNKGDRVRNSVPLDAKPFVDNRGHWTDKAVTGPRHRTMTTF